MYCNETDNYSELIPRNFFINFWEEKNDFNDFCHCQKTFDYFQAFDGDRKEEKIKEKCRQVFNQMVNPLTKSKVGHRKALQLGQREYMDSSCWNKKASLQKLD